LASFFPESNVPDLSISKPAIFAVLSNFGRENAL
jgi:hypothetical protein